MHEFIADFQSDFQKKSRSNADWNDDTILMKRNVIERNFSYP